MDIAVAFEYQRHGMGLKMLHRVEELTRRKAQPAALRRRNENLASQRLHEKAGFKPCRIHYEKVLTYEKEAET